MQSNIRRRPEGAILRTYLAAAGMTPESISKPLVGVVTASTQVLSERPDARELGNAVVSGVEAAGGMAVRWDTSRTPDLISWGHAESYSFAWRDQLADFIESWARQEALDGLVLVGDESKTLVGMAMAAARLNIAAVIVTAGPTRLEINKTEANAHVKKTVSQDPFDLLCETLFHKKKSGADGAEIAQFNQCLLTQDDHASHAVDLVLEALGTTLPGMSTAPAQSTRRHDLAYASGQRVIELIRSGSQFRRILSANAFSNAIRLNAALGGSIDVAIHLMALAHEAEVPLTLDALDKIAQETPQVCRLGGTGEKIAHRIDDLDKAGGVWAVLHSLKAGVSPTTTINGKGASELAKSNPVKDTHIIAQHRPYTKQSGIGVLKGNLAPNGALYILNQAPSTLISFHGPAQVFENEIDAAKFLNETKLKKGGFVLVVRNQGPKGGPGMRKLQILPALLESRELNKTIPILTDGWLPDTPHGLFISAVSPEGAASGPLAVLKTDDMIEIDLSKRVLTARLTDMELRIRMSRWQAPDMKARRGFLDRYSRQVSQAHEGAVLK